MDNSVEEIISEGEDGPYWIVHKRRGNFVIITWYEKIKTDSLIPIYDMDFPIHSMAVYTPEYAKTLLENEGFKVYDANIGIGVVLPWGGCAITSGSPDCVNDLIERKKAWDCGQEEDTNIKAEEKTRAEITFISWIGRAIVLAFIVFVLYHIL